MRPNPACPQETPWASAVKLVPVTADGLALPSFNYQLLQPLTPLRVETWADFATRLVRGGGAAPLFAVQACCGVAQCIRAVPMELAALHSLQARRA